MVIFCLLVIHELQNSPNSFSNQYMDFLNPFHQIFEVVKQENRTKKIPKEATLSLQIHLKFS